MHFVGLIALFLGCCFCQSFGQTTFSNVFSLKHGNQNILTDIDINNNFDTTFIAVYNLCQKDTSVNVFSSCTSISTLDFRGLVYQSQLLDSFAPEGTNRLLLTERGRLILTGHWHEPFDGRPIVMLEFDDELLINNVFEYSAIPGLAPNNEGIIETEESYYLYGYKINYSVNKRYSHIVKINKQTSSVIWDTCYYRATGLNQCHSLASLSSASLVYSQYFEDRVGSGDDYGIQIMKMNTDGILLDSFEFRDPLDDVTRIFVDSQKKLYFSSWSNPENWQELSYGRINKIDTFLQNIEWSYLLPVDFYTNARNYIIYNFKETIDGDILACGTVWDEGEDGHMVDPLNHTWNGFISRISPEGNPRWTHIYRLPNTYHDLPNEEFGDYFYSIINNVFELPTGHIFAGGTMYLSGLQQISKADTSDNSKIWYLQVDANGCIEGEECAEVVVLDGLISNLGEIPFKKAIGIFPNPTNGEITLTGIEAGTSYLISNLLGQTIEQGLIEANKILIQTTGLVLLNVLTPQGIVTEKIFVLEKGY